MYRLCAPRLVCTHNFSQRTRCVGCELLCWVMGIWGGERLFAERLEGLKHRPCCAPLILCEMLLPTPYRCLTFSYCSIQYREQRPKRSLRILRILKTLRNFPKASTRLLDATFSQGIPNGREFLNFLKASTAWNFRHRASPHTPPTPAGGGGGRTCECQWSFF